MNEDFTTPSDVTLQLLLKLVISTGIGLLIGLEREFSKQVKEKEEQFAGIRTYTLVSLLGFGAALAADHYGVWIIVSAFVALIALLTIFYVRVSKNPDNVGGTSEISLLLTFFVSVLVFLNHILIAAAITVMILVLLTYKPALHGFVKKLKQQDIRAIVQFVIISALVIPFLPDQNFGPYDAWNLRDIWRMVVLVSGISLVGYLLSKIFSEKGIVLAGIVGGLASSTAVTLSFSKRSRENESMSVISLVAIMAAATIMFPRIFIEAAVINAQLIKQLWLPMAIVTIIGSTVCFIMYRKQTQKVKQENDLQNPLNFSVALKFAVIYAVIILIVRFASDKFGESGVYIAAIISGITDVDAITISLSNLAKKGDSRLAVNGIWLAAMSNTLVKMIIVFVVGSNPLKKIAAIGFGSLLLGCGGILVYQFLLLNQ
jgi:uncharacterized membrane protein (DUF4010 family)